MMDFSAIEADKFFWEAFRQYNDLYTYVNGRIFNPARTMEDERVDKVPYIIIMHTGATAEAANKDVMFDDLTNATVEVLVVATTRQELAAVCMNVMKAVENAVENGLDAEIGFEVEYISPSVGAVQYDPAKPCMFTSITFNTSTKTL